MKHLLLLFTVFYTLTLSATENKLKQSWITSGSEFIYEVNAFGDVYDFVVYLDEVGDAISFDYYMTNDNATEGYISIPASAMADATSHMNYFSGGERTLEGQTTVFFSRGAFSDVVDGKTITIDVGRGTSRQFAGKLPMRSNKCMKSCLLTLICLMEVYTMWMVLMYLRPFRGSYTAG